MQLEKLLYFNSASCFQIDSIAFFHIKSTPNEKKGHPAELGGKIALK